MNIKIFKTLGMLFVAAFVMTGCSLIQNDGLSPPAAKFRMRRLWQPWRKSPVL